MNNNSLQAAAGQKEITPPLGTLINGEFQCRYATKIHDPLYAKCLALKNGETTLIFVVVDICAMQQDMLDEVKSAIQERTDVVPSNVLISSTHTHSAGAVVDLLMGHADLTYRKKVQQYLVDLVAETLQKLKPAKIAFGTADAPEHVVCRRYKMAPGYQAFNPVSRGRDQVKTNPFGDEESIVESTSLPDTEVAYLAVKGLDGKWIAVLANYSLHYVGDAPRGTISADYFGCFARSLNQLLAPEEAIVVMMSNGTSGEINIWDFLQPDRYPKEMHHKSAFIGQDLARKVVATMQDLPWEDDATLEGVYTQLPVGLRKVTAEELEQAKEVVGDTDYEQLTWDADGYRRAYAREQVLLAEYPERWNFRIQSFRVGSGVIGGLGGEFFAETGLALKAFAGKGKYFTICLANDYVGYVPPKHEIVKGGYETWRCRTSFLEMDAEEKIRNVLLKQIEQLTEHK